MKLKIANCAIVIPIYNEESSISETLERLRKVLNKIPDWTFEVVCVDDGSKDSTPKLLAKEPDITVLTHKVNRGYGAALRTGLDHCTHDWVFIVDADGTYPLEDLERLVSEAKEDIDMVVGAREGVGISEAPVRRLARWVLRKMVHVLTGVMVPDLNSGMRIFRSGLYKEFRHLLPMGFSFTSTITVASLYAGYGIKYLPIKYEKRTGKSNIRPVQDFFGFVVLIVRLASYFEPLRFFIPLSIFTLLLGLSKGALDFYFTGMLGSLAIIMILSAMQIFMMGIIADVIVRRAAVNTVASVRRSQTSTLTTESRDSI